ncbi:hypothetical protein, partial [Vibrio parahaemolyticus]
SPAVRRGIHDASFRYEVIIIALNVTNSQYHYYLWSHTHCCDSKCTEDMTNTENIAPMMKVSAMCKTQEKG